MSSNFDLHLASLNVEMHALQDGFNIIKNSIETLKEKEHRDFDKSIKSKEILTDDELIDLHEDLYTKIEVLYPKVFWGPYLIGIFSFFESAILELSEHIRAAKGCDLKMSDIRGDLLERTKKYYKKVLGIEYFSKCIYWETITQLGLVRHIYAHENGRVGFSLKNNIETLVSRDLGVSHNMDILVVEERFVKACLDAVLNVIGDLKDIYLGLRINNE